MEEMDNQDGSVITSTRFPKGDSNALIDELLAISDLPDAMRAQILEKSTGNPFLRRGSGADAARWGFRSSRGKR